MDIYNFNEIDFMMGILLISKVVTSSDLVGRAVVMQPGNREWTTIIESINAAGWAIPSFIIFAGKKHQGSWYRHLPRNWIIQ